METRPSSNSLSQTLARYYGWVVVGVAAVILAAGYYLAIHDQLQKISAASGTDVSLLTTQADERERLVVQLEDLETEWRAVSREQLDRIRTIVPAASELPMVMVAMKQLVEDQGLELTSFETGPLTAVPATTAGIKELNISLGVTGIDSYFRLKEFLDTITASVPFVELNSIAYIPSGEGYALNVTLYYQ